VAQESLEAAMFRSSSSSKGIAVTVGAGSRKINVSNYKTIDQVWLFFLLTPFLVSAPQRGTELVFTDNLYFVKSKRKYI
jgi:hypothetical protein